MGFGRLSDFVAGFACFIFVSFLVGVVLFSQTVGIVPPSITNSLPVMAEALSDARKATSSATSSGRLGRPKGMPPIMSISFCRAAVQSLLSWSAILWIILVAASVSVKPGETVTTRIPLGLTSFDKALL